MARLIIISIELSQVSLQLMTLNSVAQFLKRNLRILFLVVVVFDSGESYRFRGRGAGDSAAAERSDRQRLRSSTARRL